MLSTRKHRCRRLVVLINPPINYVAGAPQALDKSVPPLGVLYLATYLNHNSREFEAIVVDVPAVGMSLGRLVEETVAARPFAVGISAMTPQLQGALELARALKSASLSAPIFLGGPHISGDPHFIERYHGAFDYGITGEGERTFLASLDALACGDTLPRLQSGEITVELDSIPAPDRSLVDRSLYSDYESMVFSRGCPYACYYCSRPAVSKKVRYRSSTDMVDEIEAVYVERGGKITFQDDTITMNRKRVLGLCQEIGARKLELEWQCNTRIDLVDDELLAAMKRAGCSLIHFGIESGNETLRATSIHKGKFTNADIAEVIASCKKQGIKVAGYFMLGHPGETPETLMETRHLILHSGFDVVGVSIPTPFPGSELYTIAESQGIIDSTVIDAFADKKLGEGYSGNYPVYTPEGFDRDYLYGAMRSVNRKFYINFATFWSRFKQDMLSSPRLKQDAIDLASLIAHGVSSRKPYKGKLKRS